MAAAAPPPPPAAEVPVPPIDVMSMDYPPCPPDLLDDFDFDAFLSADEHCFASPHMGKLEKDIVSKGIAQLDPRSRDFRTALEIVGQTAGRQRQARLAAEPWAIDSLPEEALVKLYELVTRALPNLGAETEKMLKKTDDEKNEE